MEETKSIDITDMVLGLFLDSMTTNFPNQVVIDEQVKDSLKKDDKQKMTVGIQPLPPQEKCVLPYQRPTQSHQKSKQKQINEGNKDQERRRPCYDPILMSHAHFLPILVKAGAIVPKQVELAKLPCGRKHDPHATCGYHAGYVLSFSEEGPNVITNPFPDHQGQVVNAVSGDGCSDSVASSEEYQG
ncbi:hypothetical protein KIW84_014644 [Lathyrus oleraceus]|uniref:Uncharacterized protein n=1 Tax=Pisum sativum TaxID=3888 RepID=A0A9D5BNM4_PEA|nr:hypothetical protein KIW84_014644 [Pisum sativum]